MPNRNVVHIDRALTNMSVAYMQKAENFIADTIFPKVPVSKQSDLYFTYKKEDFFRDEAAERADGTESAGGDYEIEQAPPYYCRVYAFHKDVTERERVNSDDPLKPDQDATDFVTQKMLLRKEVDWASKFFKDGVWATDKTPTKKWTDPTSDPISDVTNEIVEMARLTSFRPNTLVLSPQAFYALKNHADIIDRIKYTQKGIVTLDLLATLFEVERVLVTWAVQNNANKGVDGKMDFIMGNHALLLYVAPSPGLKTPSAGYIFTWTGYEGAGAYGNRVYRVPMPWLGRETERIECEGAWDAKQVCKDLGVFFKSVI